MPAGAARVFSDSEAKQVRRLVLVLVLIGTFFFVELAGAFAARSVVLQADAVHLLMDVLALAMSVVAMRLAVQRPTERFTFGMRRAEPVAAIFNAGLILAATTQIVREGVLELESGGGEPRANIMLIVALAALVVNGLSAWLLHDALHHGHAHAGEHAHDPDNPDDVAHEGAHGHTDGHEHAHAHHGEREEKRPEKLAGHAPNLRGAWLHLAGDTLGSLAALVAAIVIRYGGPASFDVLASFLVALILVLGALRLLRDATLVLLEAAPPHLPVSAIRERVLAFPGIASVHDMHVWTLGAGHDAISVHVKVDVPDPSLASRLSRKLRDAFHVEYVTVQVETTDAEAPHSCESPPSMFRS